MKLDPFSLDRLEDIITPEPVSWWPPASGWYFAFAIAILWICVIVMKAAHRWRSNAYRRQALQELGDLDVGNFSSLSSLLKRVALVAFPREQVASLIGSDWTTFLTKTCQNVDFEAQPACRIGTASCETESDPCDARQWNRVTQLAATWIGHHDLETDS